MAEKVTEPPELTQAQRTLMIHFDNLKGMLKEMQRAKKGTYTPATIKRLEDRVQEAQKALRDQAKADQKRGKK